MDFKTIISRWPGVAELAGDLKDIHPQVDQTTFHHRVNKWAFRNNIPPRYWEDLLAAAEKRGIKLSYRDLMAAAKRPEHA